MITISSIDHIVLRTNNLDAMVHFYCDILSCNIERALAKEIGLTQLRAGDAIIDLVDVNSELGRVGGKAPTGSGNNLDHFCVQINPLDEKELITFLRQKNIACDDFSNRYGAQGFGPSLYIKDPDGNVIELKFRK